MATIELGADYSTYPTTQDNSTGDTIIGDRFIGWGYEPTSGDDRIEGGAGNDTLIGDINTGIGAVEGGVPISQGNDYLSGGADDDLIIGDAMALPSRTYSVGDDVLVGGPGNDVLYGGNMENADANPYDAGSYSVGSDTFVFNFTADTRIDTTTVTYETEIRTWVESTITETFDAYLAAHNLTRAGLTQAQFSNNYGDWLNSLVARYHDQGLGQDLDGDGKISVGINQNSSSGLPTIEGLCQTQIDAFFDDATSIAIKTGKTSQTRYFSNEFSVTSGEYVTTTIVDEITIRNVVTDAVHSGDGYDLIMDFEHGVDKLQLNGVRPADFATFFTVLTEVDGDHDGMADDTVIWLNNYEWSVTLADVNNFDIGDISFHAPDPVALHT